MAIGASFTQPRKQVIVEDGGFQLNIQELQTIYHYNLQIRIILLNNSCYGIVRQFQEQNACTKAEGAFLRDITNAL